MVVMRMKCQGAEHFGWFLAQSKYSINVAYIYWWTSFHSGPTHLHFCELCWRDPVRQLLSVEAFQEVWGFTVSKYLPRWPVKMAASVLAAHQEGLRLPVSKLLESDSLSRSLTELRVMVVTEVSLGATDMPQCSPWRDFLSWISSRRLKLWEAVCFCRKTSVPISKILP